MGFSNGELAKPSRRNRTKSSMKRCTGCCIGVVLAACLAACDTTAPEEMHLGYTSSGLIQVRQSMRWRLSVGHTDPSATVCVQATSGENSDVDLFVNVGHAGRHLLHADVALWSNPQSIPQYRSATAGPEVLCIPRPPSGDDVLVTVYGYGARLPVGNSFVLQS